MSIQSAFFFDYFLHFFFEDFSNFIDNQAAPIFEKDCESFASEVGGGHFPQSPLNPRTPPPFVESVISLSNSTNTKHKKKSQTEKV